MYPLTHKTLTLSAQQEILTWKNVKGFFPKDVIEICKLISAKTHYNLRHYKPNIICNVLIPYIYA